MSETETTETTGCAYCGDPAPDELPVLTTAHWRVVHGPPATTRAGGLKIVSTRHHVDFADMEEAEAASFGLLLRRLDRALREVTGAERVHLVSTRDRVQHFHAWLYPRHVTDELRGTRFLDAPQSSSTTDAERVSGQLRQALHEPGTDAAS